MKNLKITEVQFNPITQRESLVGFASVVINDTILLSGLGIHSKLTERGYRSTTPCRKLKDNTTLIPHYKFLTPEFKEKINKAIEDKIEELGVFGVKMERK